MRLSLPLLATLLALPALSALSACTREEEPVANRYERQKAEIENKAQTLESQVDKEVGAVEARLQNEVDTLLQNRAVTATEENAAETVNRSD